MLEFATHYHLAIDSMTAACDLDLLKYKLVPEEWKIAGELRDVLKVSYYYTFHTFTHSKIDFQGHHTLFFMWNNLATVIPAMDHINKILATSFKSPYQFSLTVYAALAVRKNAINKYYNRTDHLEVYHITWVSFHKLYHTC